MWNKTPDNDIPTYGRPISITVPVSVANDFDQMQSVMKNVMTQLGCPTCHSGHDVRFRISTDFVVNLSGEVSESVGQTLVR